MRRNHYFRRGYDHQVIRAERENPRARDNAQRNYRDGTAGRLLVREVVLLQPVLHVPNSVAYDLVNGTKVSLCLRPVPYCIYRGPRREVKVGAVEVG